MAVQVLNHVPRCKLCAHPQAAAINELLEKRSKRELATPTVLERLREMGVVNPNVDNLKGHLGQKGNQAHIRFVADETKEQEDREIEQIIAKLRSGEMEYADPSEVARVAVTIYYESLLKKHAAGEDVGLTHDHAVKFIDSLTKRKANEAQTKLLDGLGQGISRVFEKALAPADAAALPAGDVIEGEVAAVEDGD